MRTRIELALKVAIRSGDLFLFLADTAGVVELFFFFMGA